MRYVRTHCYILQKAKVPWVKLFKNREIGKKMITGHEELKPPTFKEVYEWFEGFYEFQKRPDVDEYALNDKKLRGVPGVIILKSFDTL